ncbi:MAG TPA: RelA/SpoT domain-containing protein [Acidobacteriaceae bacterium]
MHSTTSAPIDTNTRTLFQPGNYILAELTFKDDDGDMAQWSKRQQSKTEIDRVGASLIPWWQHSGALDIPDLGKRYMIVQNWRSSHGMPLLVFRRHLAKRAEKLHSKAIVAQRLKRFSSIMNKLVREPNMKLSQMQDLGGCRAIMPDITSLNALVSIYRNANDDFVQTEGNMKCFDYINHPKEDGYRGVHLVGRYKARSERNEHWNGHRIEIQIRTQLQHAFATAVETVTAFTRSPLKFGGGPDNWRRFFSLAGSIFAIQEGTSLVPNTPENIDYLVIEIRRLLQELKVRPRLRGWTKALSLLPKKEMAGATWVLLVLDVSEDTIQSTGFTDPKKAVAAVAAIETSANASRLDAVLVGVNSIKSLRTAYPNYYADTAAFITALNRTLRSHRKKETKAKRKDFLLSQEAL